MANGTALPGTLDQGLEDLRRTLSPASPQRHAGRPREGTKQAQVITLLRRPEGATVAQIAEVMNWAPHTVRGVFANLKKHPGIVWRQPSMFARLPQTSRAPKAATPSAASPSPVDATRFNERDALRSDPASLHRQMAVIPCTPLRADGTVRTACTLRYVVKAFCSTSSRAPKRPRPQRSFGRTYAGASSEDSDWSAAKFGAHMVMFADRPWEMRLSAVENGCKLHREFHGTEPPHIMLTGFCVYSSNLAEAEEEVRKYQGKFVESNFYHYDFFAAVLQRPKATKPLSRRLKSRARRALKAR